MAGRDTLRRGRTPGLLFSEAMGRREDPESGGAGSPGVRLLCSSNQVQQGFPVRRQIVLRETQHVDLVAGLLAQEGEAAVLDFLVQGLRLGNAEPDA